MFVKSLDGGKEKAHWVMPVADMGDELTCMVILDETEAMAPPSNVQLAKDTLHPDPHL